MVHCPEGEEGGETAFIDQRAVAAGKKTVEFKVIHYLPPYFGMSLKCQYRVRNMVAEKLLLLLQQGSYSNKRNIR